MELLRIYTDEGEVVIRQQPRYRSYEAMIILKPHLSDEEVQKMIDRYREYMTSNGAEIINIENWGKKNFAYEMDGLKEGIYIIISYKANPSFTEELNNQLRLDINVHRHMIVRTDKKED